MKRSPAVFPGIGRIAILAAFPILYSLRVFAPIYRNYFFSDDFTHILNIVQNGFWKFALTPWGGHMLTLRNAVFFLCWKLFGVVPAGYFAVALATHLLNVVLLLLLLRALTQNWWLASFGAALWGSAPANEKTLGWFSVHGQALGATLLLLCLLAIFRYRRSNRPVPSFVLLCWAASLLLASQCFGTATAVALALPLVLPLLIPLDRLSRWGFGIFLAVPPLTLTLLGYFLVRVSPKDSPWDGIWTIFAFAREISRVGFMFGHLILYGAGSLLLGYLVPPAASYPSVQVLVAAAAVLSFLGWSFGYASSEQRRLLVVFGVLVAAVYGSIALGRAAYFAAFFSDLGRYAASERYHYLGQIFLTVLVCLGLKIWHDRWRDLALPRPALFLTWVLMSVASYGKFGSLIDHHEVDRGQVIYSLMAVDHRVVLAGESLPVVIPNRPFYPATVSGSEFPGIVGIYAIFRPEVPGVADPVLFAVSEREYLRLQERGGRLAQLVTLDLEDRPAYHCTLEPMEIPEHCQMGRRDQGPSESEEGSEDQVVKGGQEG